MAAVYYRLIVRGLKTIEDVPLQDREAVQALLDADGR
ncbi:CD1375 family protein [Brevibacillus borstelensis]|nr:CD1375 family protein [Brevibacillus borstelensis]WNF07491.1 CD1375 family protein [Brevibacillus borstelensis]